MTNNTECHQNVRKDRDVAGAEELSLTAAKVLSYQ